MSSTVVKLAILAVLLLQGSALENDFLFGTFPDDFQWGIGSSAYQTEGAWNIDGKGESIWDRMCHTKKAKIRDGTNGDRAASSYYNFKQDVQLLKDLRVNFYRFSLSWPRILPKGTINEPPNQLGIDFYNNLINELLANDITPMVTLYHWDLPQALQDIGGWENPKIVDYFTDYATVAFKHFGDRVKTWITINDPWSISHKGYGTGQHAPGIKNNGVSDYIAGHNLLKAHAQAWHIYNNTYRSLQNGTIGISLGSEYLENKDESVDVMQIGPGYTNIMNAEKRAMQFKLGWFAHPIFSAEGDYPNIMRKRVGSRLPLFDEHWVQLIKGSSDFLGLNHYSSLYATTGSWPQIPSWEADQKVHRTMTAIDGFYHWTQSSFKMMPQNFRKLLNWIKHSYENVPVIVTENGFSDNGIPNDDNRSLYHAKYINEMLKAVVIDGCNVKAYTAWSLMDSFQWDLGYTAHYGMYQVGYSGGPSRYVTPKMSSKDTFKRIITGNGFLVTNDF